jgi:hypothetical protein
VPISINDTTFGQTSGQTMAMASTPRNVQLRLKLNF